MKKVLFLMSLVLIVQIRLQADVKVASPDGKIVTTIKTGGEQLSYDVSCDGQILMQNNTLGLKLADGTVYDRPGRVSTISGVIDQQTGSVSVRADFPNPKHLLKTGGSGNILVPYVAKDAIVIPQSATVEVQDQKFVYTVGKDNKVSYTVVQVADVNDGTNYIVTAGLKAGDRIVVEGVTRLQSFEVHFGCCHVFAAAGIFEYYEQRDRKNEYKRCNYCNYYLVVRFFHFYLSLL